MVTDVNFDQKLTNPQDIAQHIAAILKDIRFGSIEIVVHDGRIVQIDRHEKFRVKTTDK